IVLPFIVISYFISYTFRFISVLVQLTQLVPFIVPQFHFSLFSQYTLCSYENNFSVWRIKRCLKMFIVVFKLNCG
ncbi:hypothetical protein KSS87_009639, partial [Heliosperma pusillum]